MNKNSTPLTWAGMLTITYNSALLAQNTCAAGASTGIVTIAPHALAALYVISATQGFSCTVQCTGAT